MNCPQQLTHIIRSGESLYKLARYYKTTVSLIIAQNPNINPYNLQIGTPVYICPGVNFSGRQNNIVRPPYVNQPYVNSSGKTSLVSDMRLVWEQHIYWTRMLLISIADKMEDQAAITSRILQNPNDISAVFEKYYPTGARETIAGLLTEHLQIGAQLITALRDGEADLADSLNRQWYINADKMAEAFGNISPAYNREELRSMLYEHLDLTTGEVSMRLARNYPADIEAFNKVEREAMIMADYFSAGLMR